MPFKVYDKVRCVRPWGSLVEGAVYTVACVREGTEFPYVLQLIEKLPDRPGHCYNAGRFELVTEPTESMVLPADPQERKNTPITTGVLDYFPLAIAAVAQCSKAGNDQHNPGQPLHWAKEKSTDHADCIGRHLIDRGTFDTDGVRHSAKLAWRALANLQIELEQAARAK